MAQWVYKSTKHRLNGRTVPEGEKAVRCDETGSCMAHDLYGEEMEGLTQLFNREGKEGWELIQCHYHAKDLMCLWKKKISSR